MITEAELVPGIVLHLDPETLMAERGSYTCSDEVRVQGGHFFVCLSMDGDVGSWLPLYSKPGVGRVKLTSDGRTGHPKWTDAPNYWHRDQVWTAPSSAVIAAAAAGGDMSRAGSRNLLDPHLLPAVHREGGC